MSQTYDNPGENCLGGTGICCRSNIMQPACPQSAKRQFLSAPVANPFNISNLEFCARKTRLRTVNLSTRPSFHLSRDNSGAAVNAVSAVWRIVSERLPEVSLKYHHLEVSVDATPARHQFHNLVSCSVRDFFATLTKRRSTAEQQLLSA